MVDLGQKKVDLDPPFFMNTTEQKKTAIWRSSMFRKSILYYFALAYLLETSFQSITLKNASMYSGRLFW